ncbi:MAG: 50S ribosomal protein L4 [Anaerolineales bacterium]
MKMQVVDRTGKQVKEIDLPENIFGVEVNVGLMHQAYVRQMANARQANAHTKSRGEVHLTKSKWYRQKGTGRARHGARSAPIFVGGGRAHGPRNNRNYTKRMPKKMRRQALRSALSALVRDEQIVLVDDLTPDEVKTKLMREALHSVAGTTNALVLHTAEQQELARSVRNLKDATALNVNYLNIRDLLKHDKVIISLDALENIQLHLG